MTLVTWIWGSGRKTRVWGFMTVGASAERGEGDVWERSPGRVAP